MAENATQEKAAGQKKPRTLSKLERLQKELEEAKKQEAARRQKQAQQIKDRLAAAIARRDRAEASVYALEAELEAIEED